MQPLVHICSVLSFAQLQWFSQTKILLFFVKVLCRLNKILHLSHAGNCVTAQLRRLLRQSQHSDCTRVKQIAPTAFSLHSRSDTSQTSLMTFGCTECWWIQNLRPGCGSSVLNTDLLLSPTMKSVNLDIGPMTLWGCSSFSPRCQN